MVNQDRHYAMPLENGTLRVVLTKDQPRLAELILRSYRGEVRSLQPCMGCETVYIAVPETGIDSATLAKRLDSFIGIEYE